jgi:hypothetical protein
MESGAVSSAASAVESFMGTLMCGKEFAWRHVLAAVCLGHDTVVTRQRQGGNKTRTIQYTEVPG